MTLAIHWFRRDLRLTDNTALNAAIAAHGQVLPVYILSSWKHHHRWTGPARQQFLAECLASLDAGLKKAGSALCLRQGDAVEQLVTLVRETGACAIYANRDPDPFGRAMETRLLKAATQLGVQLHLFKDTALHERDEVLTGSQTAFRVFTPYSRAWAKLEKPLPGPTATRLLTPGNIPSLPLPTLEHWSLTPDGTTLPAAGEHAAQARLERFLENAVYQYVEQRDLPALEGTSRISQDLRFGLLSIRGIYARLMECAKGLKPPQARSLQVYINELCWREFYFQVLWNKPEVLEHEYSESYRGMPWKHDAEAFERWCQGHTGFPIVDAGMRQLRQTGFMHNRVRMIVAMFLTKDLHLDWRAGEQWFMQRLLDGEIASNNGGWQWSSGTGTDAAPYFRIQNPWTQGLRFDAAGAYIKRWVPELQPVPAAKLHQPPTPGLRLANAYPLPMVDHSTERHIALTHYKLHLTSISASAKMS
jgi:deoxyribodipyrimidine photo-lyase